MKKTYRDGWHTICGYRVWIEDGLIRRGITDDGQRPLYIYRACRTGGWDGESCETVGAFRAGVRRGTITMM